MTQISSPSEEISIAEIVSRVWRIRGWVFLCAMVGIAVGAIVVTMSAIRASRPVTYFIDLNGITNEKYPGGAVFSPQDLLVPEVIAELRRRFQLSPDVKLREAITVSYGSPIADGLHRMYQRRLETRNLSQVDLATINEEYHRELKSALRSTLRIEVNYTLAGFDGSTGIAVARALPDIWTEIYSTRLNIFADDRLTPVVITSDDQKMKDAASVLVVDASHKSMGKGLSVLAMDNRFSALLTEDGTSVAALRERLTNFDLIYFNSLKAFSFQAKDGVSSSYIYATRQRVAEHQRNIVQYDAAIDKLIRPRPTAMISDATSATMTKEGLQLGESGIAEIIGLSERASNNELIQELFRKRERIALEASALQRELDTISADQGIADLGNNREKAILSLKEIISRYNEMLSRAEQGLRGKFKSLHNAAAGPSIPGSFLPDWSIPALFVAGLVGALIGLLGGLFLANYRSQ